MCIMYASSLCSIVYSAVALGNVWMLYIAAVFALLTTVFSNVVCFTWPLINTQRR